MRRVVPAALVLLTLVPQACQRDEATAPQLPRPRAQAAAGSECATPPPGTIWCDDFEVDRLSSYFEHLSPSSFARTAGVGLDGSSGMRAVYTPGVAQAGDLKVAFGRSPDPDFVKPVDAGTAAYRDVYWRAYLKTQAGWSGGGGGAFTRATVLASPAWAQAAIGHVFAPDGDALVLDPVRGTDEAGNLVTTGYNDVDHFTWLGNATGATAIFGSSSVGQWYCIEAHMKLNDPGQANGVLEYWVNGALDAQRTGLNFVGSYSAYGINAIFFENYWNATAPQTEERYWDNLVVATQPIGCGTGTSYSITDLGALGGDYSWATDVNAGGQVIGYSYTRGWDRQNPDLQEETKHAFLWENGVLHDLGTLGGEKSRASAINGAGQIIGTSTPAAGAPHGFLWENGTMRDLDPGGGRSDAVAINDAGQVAGNMDRGQQHAALWDNGTLQDLGTLGGAYAEAHAINAGGQVIGYSHTPQQIPHAFVWLNGTMQDLGTLGGPESYALAINDRGQIVGYSSTASGTTHAFLWDNGTMQDLGTLGGSSSRAEAINPLGQAVGFSYTPSGAIHAVLWENGTMRDLGTLGGDISYARAINAHGQVAGVSATATGETHAFLWDGHMMRDLGTLGGTVSEAIAINDAGQAVGRATTPAGVTRAVLWTPSATP